MVYYLHLIVFFRFLHLLQSTSSSCSSSTSNIHKKKKFKQTQKKKKMQNHNLQPSLFRRCGFSFFLNLSSTSNSLSHAVADFHGQKSLIVVDINSGSEKLRQDLCCIDLKREDRRKPWLFVVPANVAEVLPR